MAFLISMAFGIEVRKTFSKSVILDGKKSSRFSRMFGYEVVNIILKYSMNVF